MSIRQVAVKTGINYSTLNAWANGGMPSKMKDILKVKEFFSTTLDYLLLAEGPRHRAERSPLSVSQLPVLNKGLAFCAIGGTVLNIQIEIEKIKK